MRRGPKPQRRFDLQPLLDAVGVTDNEGSRHARTELASLHDATGLSKISIWRYRTEGVPMWQADKLATTLGYHPCELWPDFYTPEDEAA